jgi:glycosyl transferase family 25
MPVSNSGWSNLASVTNVYRQWTEVRFRKPIEIWFAANSTKAKVGFLPGEIGCYLSHYKILQRIVRENIPRACILEDDAVLEPDFPNRLLSPDAELDRCPVLKFEKIFSKTPLTGFTLSRYRGRSIAFLFPKGRTGGAAYSVTTEGAGLMLRAMTPVRAHFDMHVFSYEDAKFITHHVIPALVRQEGGSTIRHRAPGDKQRQRTFAYHILKRFGRAHIDARRYAYQLRVFGFKTFAKQQFRDF